MRRTALWALRSVPRSRRFVPADPQREAYQQCQATYDQEDQADGRDAYARELGCHGEAQDRAQGEHDQATNDHARTSLETYRSLRPVVVVSVVPPRWIPD